MPAMFDMALPWWELTVRAALIYFALLLMVRISGKRTVGQFTPFDLLVVMLLSESVSASLSGGDNSLTAGLILAGTLILINLAIAFLTARSHKIQNVIEGRPILIGRHGEIFKDRLLANHISSLDFDQALREVDCEIQDMRCAFLEADGKISILKESG
ncbi:MAG: hypothetical protein JWP96_2582 [Polaromonas sp.]|nr:hypothetical protein [Polaromonas sp.]